MRRKASIFEYILAIAIRIVLRKSGFCGAIEDRVEISTPLNSWKRLKEGVLLSDTGIDPYMGDMIHEIPLILYVFHHFINLPTICQDVVFVCVDTITAYILQEAAFKYLQELKNSEDKKSCSSQCHGKISAIDAFETPVLVTYAYLFNPYIILNCVASTSTVFTNLLQAGFLYGLVNGHLVSCTCLLSLMTAQSLYPVLLLAPLFTRFQTRKDIFKIVGLFLATMIGLILSGYRLSGNWAFLQSTYKFIMNVQDLTPNIGLFWYFFTEMFEHFRALFISALQINATVLYLIPLSLHLKNEPIFLTFIIMALTVVFKSYPCLGEVGLYLAILPLWRHLFFFMQQLFVVGCIFVITSVLGPTVWHLWIYSASANANFFFGVTLAFATAQIFLITDLLFAHKKREFALKYGWPDESSKSVLILD